MRRRETGDKPISTVCVYVCVDRVRRPLINLGVTSAFDYVQRGIPNDEEQSAFFLYTDLLH